MTLTASAPPHDALRRGGFVAFSVLSVPIEGRDALEAAFKARMGAVDDWPGFRGLEVWESTDDPAMFTMVSWWDDEASFKAYMGSTDHRTSHRRIPGGEQRPRPVSFQRFQVVAR